MALHRRRARRGWCVDLRYFVDTEFLEDGRTIEPISVGIVAEDGREYYAEFVLTNETLGRIVEHEWLMANVWPHLVEEARPRDQIRDEVRAFCRPGGEPEFWALCGAYDWVLLNQLHGSMVDHPTSWPYWCNDLSQYALHLGVSRHRFPDQTSAEHHALADARWTASTWHWLREQELAR